MKKFVLALLYLGLAGLLWFLRRRMSVTNFSPEAGLPGTIVEIEGKGFDPDPFNNIVTIGGTPTRVISGNSSKLRVVALRNLATGVIVVQAGARVATSAEKFRREGSTACATRLKDSDSKLVTGQGHDVDKRYDMQAHGLEQKILVVLTKPSDINPQDLAPVGKTAWESIHERLDAANVYFDQASYHNVSAAFTPTPDWIGLSQTRDFYCWQQDDIDRAQAALDALTLDPSANEAQIKAAEDDLNEAKNRVRKLQQPDFLFAEALLGAKAAVADFNDYSDYLVIVAGPRLRGANYGARTGYHAESVNPVIKIGPFDIDFVSPKGITYVAQGADWGRIVHELSHFFASGDIYEKEFADGSFIEGNAAPFSMMGDHDTHPLYIGYDFEKYLDYFNENTDPSDPQGNVKFLEWGNPADKNESFHLIAHAKTEDSTGDDIFHLLRLRVTDGLLYYVEVRQQPDPSFGADADYVFDTSIPLGPSNPSWNGGVIIYKVVENNNQSNNNERKVSLLPPGRMLQVGESFEDPARTIKISVTHRLADRPAKYRVRVEWGHLPAADPNGQFDLRITPWSPPPWESPDIWANSIKNDETSPKRIVYKNHEPGDDTKPVGNGDPPWVGHENTLFARVTNQGVVTTPESVKVTFYVNTPPGVGDNGNWAPFDTVDIGVLAAGETRVVEATREWRPAKGEHTCVKVQIHPLTGEVTFDNNQAQENFSEFETGASSPYAPVELDFLARNPYDSPGVMDINARNVPAEWFVAFNHGSVWLPAKAEKTVHAVIWTDRTPDWEQGDKRNVPRKSLINIEGWMDRWGDQAFAVGGITAFVQAVRNVNITIDPRGEARSGQPFSIFGQVSPIVGIVPIAIHITAPDGSLSTERTQTTNSGQISYQTRYKSTKAGQYKIQGFVLGGSLAGEAESRIHAVNVQ